MNAVNEILELLNPWWKDGRVSKELARQYRRKQFDKVLKIIRYRQIIILSGLRRVGKTTLLYQIIEHLLEKHNAKHILYFNFDKKVGELTEILDNYETLMNVNWKKEKVFIFLDEIAKLDGWANKIKLVYDAFPNVKFFISSSSSIGLEGEAMKNLGGRYFFVNVQPLDFVEFLELRGKSKFLENSDLWKKEIQNEALNYKLKCFPEIINWNDKLLIKDYLRTMIIDKIVKQDLPEKFKNINQDLLLNLLEIFLSEPSMYLDYDGMSQKLRISKKTLIQHIFYLEFSYLIRRIKNYRISASAASRKMQRIYAYWWTLTYCYTDKDDMIMENVIASLLDARYYWRKNGKEIDFLKFDKKKIVPIEVKDKKTIINSDLKNLSYFMNKYNIKDGFIIYHGEEDTIIIDSGKVKLVPLWKWLLGKYKN